jgi:hypothetical protein
MNDFQEQVMRIESDSDLDTQNIKQDKIYPAENDTQLMDSFVTPKGYTSKNNGIGRDHEGKYTSIKIPTRYKERLNADIPTSNLTDFDKFFCNESFEIAESLQNYATLKGIDLSFSCDYFADLAEGQALVSKGHKGWLLDRMRTSRQEGFTRAEKTLTSSFPETKKKGWFSWR